MIYLYDWSGEIVAMSKYDYPKRRKEIIEEWKAMYGQMFNRCFLQIAPNANGKVEKYNKVDGKYINVHSVLRKRIGITSHKVNNHDEGRQ